MTPHVREWWDQDVNWTIDLITEKYGCYVKGYKRVEKSDEVIERPMHAFIIEADSHPIGYIQYYDRNDWLPQDYKEDFQNIPKPIAAIDVYIGDPHWIGKGIGSIAIKQFLDEHVFKEFASCTVDPDTANTGAIRAYEKAGFYKLQTLKNGTITLMLAKRNNILTKC